MKQRKEPNTGLIRICSKVFAILGFVLYQAVIVPQVFGSAAEHGFSASRMLGAAVVAAICGMVGHFVGRGLDSLFG